MKRFYNDVRLFQKNRGHFIALDGKNIRTPLRQVLELPTLSLAQAVAEEWRVQGEEIRPAEMPLTQLANIAIDQTRPQRAKVIEQVAAYARTDLVCYWSTQPFDLVKRQEVGWRPLLDWSESELGARLAVTTDLAPINQSDRSLLAICGSVAQLDDFSLTGLDSATSAVGSVIIALALLHHRLDPEEACSLAELDEEYQSERWGVDPEASAQRASVRRAIAVAASFMTLSQDN